jgi:hypothetical protein
LPLVRIDEFSQFGLSATATSPSPLSMTSTRPLPEELFDALSLPAQNTHKRRPTASSASGQFGHRASFLSEALVLCLMAGRARFDFKSEDGGMQMRMRMRVRNTMRMHVHAISSLS